jgi:hypothetical protein
MNEVIKSHHIAKKQHTKDIMTTWHTPCGAGGLCQKPVGTDTAGPAHKCIECRLKVHTICSMSWDDPSARNGEGHKCFECAGTQQPPLVPPPPDAAATSPRQPQDQQEEQEEDQKEQQQQ